MVLVGNYGKYYTVEGFLRKVKDYNVYVDKLSKRYLEFGYGEMGRSQEKAWEDCYSCLTAALESLPLGWKKKAYVIFEYVLPDHATWTRKFQNEKHIRADVLLLTDNIVLVLEFKQYDEPFIGHVRQGKKYATRLERYHVGSNNMKIHTILALTRAMDYFNVVEDVNVCSGDRLGETIKRLIGHNPSSVNMNAWLNSGFYFRER